MKVLFKPLVSPNKLRYEFSGQEVKAKLQVYLGTNLSDEPMYFHEEDTFDFSSFPEGESLEIETDLAICPILKAAKINGDLSLVLVKFVESTLTTQELYPKWIEIK